MKYPLTTPEATDPHTVRWRKSSYSDGGASNCVEVAGDRTDVVPVRDSKDPYGPALAFSPAGWSAFVSAVRRGEFPV